MSIEQRETDAYAERRRRQNLAMAAARADIAAEVERQRLADLCRAVVPWQSMPALRQVAALVGIAGPSRNRVEYENGKLEEVVTDGGAHLERMSDRTWFLECTRRDGSSFCVWFEGRVTMTEDRPAARLQHPHSEDAGKPWPGVDSGAEGEL